MQIAQRIRDARAEEPETPPWWLSVVLGIVATGVVLAPVWVPILWDAVRG